MDRFVATCSPRNRRRRECLLLAMDRIGGPWRPSALFLRAVLSCDSDSAAGSIVPCTLYALCGLARSRRPVRYRQDLRVARREDLLTSAHHQRPHAETFVRR